MHLPHGTTVGVVLGVMLIMPGPSRAADDRSGVDEIIKPFLKDKPYLGLVVGITRPAGHQILGYGRVTLNGKQQPPTRDTIFEIGSITKAFTGTLLADQVLAGVVRLDDPVQKHLPDGLTVPRRDERDITLLHLATHTSGLPVQPPFIGLFALSTKAPADPYAEYDRARLTRTLANIQLARPIGSRFEYSNLGVGLLGHALAHAAKAKDVEDLLARRLAKPLDLTDTRIQLSAEQSERLAPGHNRNGEATPGWTFAYLEACGGLRSTARDLLVFVDAGLDRRKAAARRTGRACRRWRPRPRGRGAPRGSLRGAGRAGPLGGGRPRVLPRSQVAAPAPPGPPRQVSRVVRSASPGT